MKRLTTSLTAKERSAVEIVDMLEALERMQEILQGIAGRRVVTDMEWRVMWASVKEISTGVKAVGQQMQRAQDEAQWVDGVLG